RRCWDRILRLRVCSSGRLRLSVSHVSAKPQAAGGTDSKADPRKGFHMRSVFVLAVFLPLPVCLPAQERSGEETANALLVRAKQVLAKLDGEYSLAGLKEPVEVRRDRWGVAHIYAKNAPDLFFGQGFVAAQDRLFQLELWRRQAAGEMAEILG